MLINTPESLEYAKQDMLSCLCPVVDTETDGLNPWGTMSSDPNHIIGISVYAEREAYYFPFRHQAGINLPIESMDFFRWYLSNPDRVFGGFNYKFDMHMLWQEGVPYAPNIEDAMLSAHLLNENEEEFRLKYLGDKYLPGVASHEESVLKNKVVAECERLGIPCSVVDNNPHSWKAKMWVLPPEEVEPYACDDVRITKGLLDLHKPAMQYWQLYDIWKQVCYYAVETAKIECRGVVLDLDLINKYSGEATDMAKEPMARLREMCGYDINVNSSKQVCAFLQIDSSAAEILEVMAEGEGGEAAKLVMLVRGWLSVKSRYYDPYLRLCDKESVLRTNLNLHGTISGRLSSTNPNLQAVARQTEVFKVKEVFVARPGCTMVSMDYSQAEMRLASFYAKEETMAGLLRNGADPHGSTAKLLGIPRDAAKRINFGVIYGIGKKELAMQLRIPEGKAAGYLKQYHALYPGFRKLMNACEAEAEQNGYIRMWTGRMRHYNAKTPSHKAMSNLVQGGVAEMMRVAIQKASVATRDLQGHILLQIHDQVLSEFPDETVQLAIPVLKAIMETTPFDPPMKVDVHYGRRWGVMEKWLG